MWEVKPITVLNIPAFEVRDTSEGGIPNTFWFIDPNMATSLAVLLNGMGPSSDVLNLLFMDIHPDEVDAVENQLGIHFDYRDKLMEISSGGRTLMRITVEEALLLSRVCLAFYARETRNQKAP